MSDSAFKTAPYPGYTTTELRCFYNEAVINEDIERMTKLSAEISRREAVMLGDESQMTQGELLRFIRTGKAR